MPAQGHTATQQPGWSAILKATGVTMHPPRPSAASGGEVALAGAAAEARVFLI